MKIIFLDIDGCLNTNNTTDLIPFLGYKGLEKGLLELLKGIVEATGAKIVLISTWRNFPEAKQYFLNRIEQLGLKNDYIGDTSCFGNPRGTTKRAGEIVNFLLQRTNVERFAIIDDSLDAQISKMKIEGKFFKIDENWGITKEDAGKIIEYLNY